MGNPNTVSEQLKIAGFEDISFYRSDKPIKVGGDVEEALEVVKSLGPAGEILRLAGEKADPFMPQIDEKLREMYVEYTDPDGAVRAPASVWIISAKPAPRASCRAARAPGTRPPRPARRPRRRTSAAPRA